MAQLVVLTTRVYIDHDRLIPPQGITPVLRGRFARGNTAASRSAAAILLTALDSAKQSEEMN
jgi:hypothetical protein